MKVCAIIPARGGSKRVPKKNIYNLNGKPLISYVLDTAKQCKLIDEVWVSTDDPEISTVSFLHNAYVIKRPSELCTDTASSESALIHFTEHVKCDIMVFIQATSPMLKTEFLEDGINKILSGEYDSVLSVCKDNRFYWDKNCGPINYDPQNRPRTQDKEPWFKETGSFYITRTASLLESKCRLSGKVGYVEVPEIYSYEIDTLEDMEILSSIMSKQ